MKRMKKVMAVLLGIAMTVGMLAGCGSSGADGNVSNTEGNTADSAAAPAADSGTDTVADTSAAVDTSEHVDLKMYLVGDKPEGFDDVYAKINEILEAKLNCSLSVDWLDWSEHTTKYSLLFSGNEDFDMIFTATSWCHYEQTVALGGFKALDEDFIKTYAPDIWETLPEIAWQQATIDGSIYMVPANYTEVTPDCYAIRGDLMDEYGIDDVASYEDVVNFFKASAEHGIYGTTRAGGLYWPWFHSLGYEIIGGAPSEGELVLFNSMDPNDTNIKYVLEWDAFSDYCHEMKELADAGCWPTDVLSSTAERQDGLVTGRASTLGWNLASCKLYAEQANAEHPDWNINVYHVAKDGTYVGTRYINGGMGININSKNPERAMMVINEFATNQEIQDLAQLGIEGVNWEPVGDNQYKVVDGNQYTTSNNWGWRNMDIMRTVSLENPTELETKAAELEKHYLENTREYHVLDGFTFDTTPVSVQYAAVEAAMGTYFDPLLSGLVDDVDSTLEQLRSALDAAGVQDVLTEMQKQVDAYVADRQ